MARAQKIDLGKLSIATLIESFATAMDAALARRAGDLLPRWAVWTVMAATLTELWSRLLLPSDAPAARAAVEEAVGPLAERVLCFGEELERPVEEPVVREGDPGRPSGRELPERDEHSIRAVDVRRPC